MSLCYLLSCRAVSICFPLCWLNTRILGWQQILSSSRCKCASFIWKMSLEEILFAIAVPKSGSDYDCYIYTLHPKKAFLQQAGLCCRPLNGFVCETQLYIIIWGTSCMIWLWLLDGPKTRSVGKRKETTPVHKTHFASCFNKSECSFFVYTWLRLSWICVFEFAHSHWLWRNLETKMSDFFVASLEHRETVLTECIVFYLTGIKSVTDLRYGSRCTWCMETNEKDSWPHQNMCHICDII